MALYDTQTLYDFDRKVAKGTNTVIIGTDEAGRGPLAGPVIASAVQLDLSSPIEGINDSKKISERKREKLYERITREAIFWSIGSASWEEIDSLNILEASLLAMTRSINAFNFSIFDACILIDGNKKLHTFSSTQQVAVVKGDSKSASIAAASIIAKVTRDRIMKEYHEVYPHYEFNRHKGYPTELHRNKVATYGLCPIHRKTFCMKLISQVKLDL